MIITICFEQQRISENTDSFSVITSQMAYSTFQGSIFVVWFTYWSKLKALYSLRSRIIIFQSRSRSEVSNERKQKKETTSNVESLDISGGLEKWRPINDEFPWYDSVWEKHMVLKQSIKKQTGNTNVTAMHLPPKQRRYAVSKSNLTELNE